MLNNLWEILSILQFRLTFLFRCAIWLCLLLGVTLPFCRMASFDWNITYWGNMACGLATVIIGGVLWRLKHARKSYQLGGRLFARIFVPEASLEFTGWAKELYGAYQWLLSLLLLVGASVAMAFRHPYDPKDIGWIAFFGTFMPAIAIGLIWSLVNLSLICLELLERGVLYSYKQEDGKITHWFLPWDHFEYVIWQDDVLTLHAPDIAVEAAIPPNQLEAVKRVVAERLPVKTARDVKLAQFYFAPTTAEVVEAGLTPPDESQLLEPSQAIAEYSWRIEREPARAQWYYERAIAFRQLANLDAALWDLGMAIQCDSRWVDCYLLRAEILETLGRTEEAAEDERMAFWLQNGG